MIIVHIILYIPSFPLKYINFNFQRANFGVIPQVSCLNCRFPEKCEIGVMELISDGSLEHDAHLFNMNFDLFTVLVYNSCTILMDGKLVSLHACKDL